MVQKKVGRKENSNRGENARRGRLGGDFMEIF